MPRNVGSSMMGSVLLLMAGMTPAAAQKCPPHSHAAAVAFPGNLRSAQCFCDPGFRAVGGVCLRASDPVRPQPQPKSKPVGARPPSPASR